MKASEAGAALAAGVLFSGTASGAAFSSGASVSAGSTGDGAACAAASVTCTFAGVLLPFAAATEFCRDSFGAVLGLDDPPASTCKNICTWLGALACLGQDDHANTRSHRTEKVQNGSLPMLLDGYADRSSKDWQQTTSKLCYYQGLP